MIEQLFPGALPGYTAAGVTAVGPGARARVGGAVQVPVRERSCRRSQRIFTTVVLLSFLSGGQNCRSSPISLNCYPFASALVYNLAPKLMYDISKFFSSNDRETVLRYSSKKMHRRNFFCKPLDFKCHWTWQLFCTIANLTVQPYF